MTIIPLETRPLEIKREVIELLEEALGMAKKGEVIGLGMVLVKYDREVWTRAAKSDCLHSVIAGTAYLQFDLIRGA